jgi:hypothetical protein
MRTIINFIILPFFAFRLMLCLDPETALKLYGKIHRMEAQDSLLKDRFSKKDVFNTDFCKQVFYTWTTKKQIEQLRKTKVLLFKSVSETKGYSLYDASLRDSALARDPFAKILLEDRFSKKRFAWTNAWATVMGWEDEKYGDHLIRIELKKEAVIGYLDLENRSKPLSFYDMSGKELTLSEVTNAKDRIAAVYHLNARKKTRVTHYRGSYSGRTKIVINAPFREYVIVNESMIESWSYGDERVISELKEEAQLMKDLSTYCSNGSCYRDAFYWGERNTWEKKENIYNMEDSYYAATAFLNDLYLFNQKRIKAISKKMSSVIKEQGTLLAR